MGSRSARSGARSAAAVRIHWHGQAPRRRHASDECIGKNEMKISARNFLEGKIKEVHKGATTAHVEIELNGGETLISSITNEAVEELDLKKGIQAYAVIKASDVMIAIK
jgi:molybdopterin-binding protein